MGSVAPWPDIEGSWVGGDEGGERGFFLAAAPESSFNKPPAFLSFCKWRDEERMESQRGGGTRQRINRELV